MKIYLLAFVLIAASALKLHSRNSLKSQMESELAEYAYALNEEYGYSMEDIAESFAGIVPGAALAQGFQSPNPPGP